jgi:hypothetical protein
MSNETFEMPNHYFKCQKKWRLSENINEYFEMSNQNLKPFKLTRFHFDGGRRKMAGGAVGWVAGIDDWPEVVVVVVEHGGRRRGCMWRQSIQGPWRGEGPVRG